MLPLKYAYYCQPRTQASCASLRKGLWGGRNTLHAPLRAWRAKKSAWVRGCTTITSRWLAAHKFQQPIHSNDTAHAQKYTCAFTKKSNMAAKIGDVVFKAGEVGPVFLRPFCFNNSIHCGTLNRIPVTFKNVLNFMKSNRSRLVIWLKTRHCM
jgi:hypothetical protein